MCSLLTVLDPCHREPLTSYEYVKTPDYPPMTFVFAYSSEGNGIVLSFASYPTHSLLSACLRAEGIIPLIEPGALNPEPILIDLDAPELQSDVSEPLFIPEESAISPSVVFEREVIDLTIDD